MIGAFGLDLYGIGVYGYQEEESIFDTAPADFDFSAVAQLSGDKITVTYNVPLAADSPDWDRRIVLLRKLGEYPQAIDDPTAYEILDQIYSDEALTISVDDSACSPGVYYYYALFALRHDGIWVCDKVRTRDSAYTYGTSTELADYMYKGLPRGYRTEDTSQDLYKFFQIIFAMFRALKMDAKVSLDLVSPTYIQADLIKYLDQRIGWPTWLYQGELAQREETKAAIDRYQRKGREEVLDEVLEECSDYTISIVEGWKYVMFSNYKYECIVPDTTDPDTTALLGTENDIVKYTNSSTGWRSVSGLGFFVYGVEDETELDPIIIDRMLTMIEFLKASYVTYALNFDMSVEGGGEVIEIADDWYEDIWA